MSFVQSVDCNELRVVLCIAFDKHAPPAQLAAFKSTLIQSENSLHSVETTGSFDFILEVAAPDMAAYRRWLEATAEPMAKLTSLIETSFVCKRFIRRQEVESAIWVRCDDGYRRVDCAAIDKIKAEGDYVKIHSGEQSWMVHRTLHSMLDSLDPGMFVQLHRSTIARCGFVDRMIHEGRHWIAELHDGTREPVGQSHVSGTLSALMSHPATFRQGSSNLASAADSTPPVQRKVNDLVDGP